MPKDYELNSGSVSGLEGGRGPGKIAGAPEGSGKNAPGPPMQGSGSPKPREGVIAGQPVGIEGKIRRAKSKGQMEAIKRKLG